MERDMNLDEISDGKLYEANDMVRLGCGDCDGCSACCHGMGDTIVLDPYDIWQLTGNLHHTFEQLLSQGKIALGYPAPSVPRRRTGGLPLSQHTGKMQHPFLPAGDLPPVPFGKAL